MTPGSFADHSSSPSCLGTTVTRVASLDVPTGSDLLHGKVNVSDVAGVLLQAPVTVPASPGKAELAIVCAALPTQPNLPGSTPCVAPSTPSRSPRRPTSS